MELLLSVIGADAETFDAFIAAEADGADEPGARSAGAEAFTLLTEGMSWRARQARREVMRILAREG
jgi:hypothetical protein